MAQPNKKVLIVAGEASGDLHGANLVHQVKKIAPQIQFYGMGAELMRQAGVELLVNSNELSIIGLLKIVTKFPKIYRAFARLRYELLHTRPNLLLLIDYPGFNLRLAKIAHKAGVKVLYFISPKVWAWNQQRIKIIKKHIDLMAVIFPFEVELYQRWGIPVTFVGNPLLRLVQPHLTRSAAYQTFKLDPQCKTIGLFPGSRQSEIKHLLPLLLETAKLLSQQNPQLQFVLPQASSIKYATLQTYLTTSKVPIKVIAGHTYDLIQLCDAIVAASGTATLEIALMGVPLVIIYKTSWLEYQIAKRVIKIPYIGLCNILANNMIVPELLQQDATPQNISRELNKILNDVPYRQTMVANLVKVKNHLAASPHQELAPLISRIVEKPKSPILF